jgi:hypothetical protein
MKLLREHINEKFEEQSDPIKDMNIGLKNNLKKYELDNMRDFIRISEDDLYKIYAFLGHDDNDIYWLGDTALENGHVEYFNRIFDFCEKNLIEKKPKYNLGFMLRKMGKLANKSVITTYNTTKGKFLTIEYLDAGKTQYTYFGDLDAAFNAQVVQNKLFDDI